MGKASEEEISHLLVLRVSLHLQQPPLLCSQSMVQHKGLGLGMAALSSTQKIPSSE